VSKKKEFVLRNALQTVCVAGCKTRKAFSVVFYRVKDSLPSRNPFADSLGTTCCWLEPLMAADSHVSNTDEAPCVCEFRGDVIAQGLSHALPV